MDKSLLANTRGLVLLPPDPLLNDTRCRNALLHCFNEKPVHQAVSLPDTVKPGEEKRYDLFFASKISTNLIVWDLDERQSPTWNGVIFPSPIAAAILPIIHPISSFHAVLSEYKQHFTQERQEHELMVINHQKAYLRNQISPIKVFLQIPIILVYIQEMEETTPLADIIGSDLGYDVLSVAQPFICKIGETDTFTSDFKDFYNQLSQ